MFFDLNICGVEVKPYKPSRLLQNDCRRSLSQFDWKVSHNIHIQKQFYENVWKVFDKSFLRKTPIKTLDVNNVFLLRSKLSLI